MSSMQAKSLSCRPQMARAQPKRCTVSRSSASPNFMDLLTQVGKDLAAMSKQEHKGQSQHGKVLQLQGAQQPCHTSQKYACPVVEVYACDIPGPCRS